MQLQLLDPQMASMDQLFLNLANLLAYRSATTMFYTSVIIIIIAWQLFTLILPPTILRLVLDQVLTPVNSIIYAMSLLQIHHSMWVTQAIIDYKSYHQMVLIRSLSLTQVNYIRQLISMSIIKTTFISVTLGITECCFSMRIGKISHWLPALE